VTFVPGIPDRDLFPIAGPGHLEHAEAALFKYLHAVIFYRYLYIGRAGPVSQNGFGILFPHDDDVKGLRGPEVADSHLKLMQCGALGRFF
jgi:hypothetical protein